MCRRPGVSVGGAAFAAAETFRWPKGLNRTLFKASNFYGVVILGTVLGIAVNLTSLDPIKALYWSAIINGVIAVPLMVMMMLMVSRRKVMGSFVASTRVRASGWLATALIAGATSAMFVTWVS